MDSDDEWLPEKLEKQIDKFKYVSPGTGLIYTGYSGVSEQTGETLFENMGTERGDVFKSMVEKRLALGDTTPLVKKECFQKVGLYDTEFLSCQSSDMWIRVSKYYQFDFVPEVLCRFYFHRTQNTASFERRIQGQDRLMRKYQHYLSKTLLFNRLSHLGILCCYQGDFQKAGGYFAEAISNNPRDIYTYIRFLLCKFVPVCKFAFRLYQARLKKRYAKVASKHNGIILW